MSTYQPSKKIRLSTNNANIPTSNNDLGLWGDDPDIDEDVIQQIETQGFSQYPICDTRPTNSKAFCDTNNVINKQAAPHYLLQDDNDDDDLVTLLQTKTGEVKNLRVEMEHKEKEHQTQIIERDNQIDELKKQISGKESEIMFLKMERQISISKAKQSLNCSIKSSPIANSTSTFKDRFSFGEVKHESKELKVFNFATKLDQGDILHKLLKSILASDVNIVTPVLPEINSNENKENGHSQIVINENDFIVHLKSLFLQLCWCTSFTETRAHQIIIFILNRSQELLTSFYQNLSRLTIETTNSKSETITLSRLRDASIQAEPRDLLKHTKLFPSEKGIAVRQTITAIANMIKVHSDVAEMLLEPGYSKASRCSCIDHNEIVGSSCNSSKAPTTSKNDMNFVEKMEVDESPNSGKNRQSRNFLLFDIVALTHDIVQEITVRNKSLEYEGILSSILHLYSVICSRETNLIYQEQEILITNTIQKMLFSLPSFVVIRDIVEFLHSSTRYSFSASLCCRSASRTFSENFKCYNFTKETCMLQVLCAYIEMMKKNPEFVRNYTSWILSSISESHKVQWVNNKTDSDLCECLLMLEQVTIKVILSCIEQYNDAKLSSSSKSLLKSSLSRCVSIFQLFRCKDIDFDRHIFRSRGEYRVMLHSLVEIINDHRTKNFVNQEYDRVNNEQKYDLSPEARDDVVKSFLKLYNYHYYL